jgi:mRNA-degrading endonuclease RelE of RelBE toxin-antitoxin system
MKRRLDRLSTRRVFPISLDPEVSGWALYRHTVRAQMERIIDLLEDPCRGFRLRQPKPRPKGLSHYWDEFCSFDIGRNYRIVYRIDQESRRLLIDLIGPRAAHGVATDVYETLRHVYDLPDDAGHAQDEKQSCCSSLKAPWPGTGDVPAREMASRLARLAG